MNLDKKKLINELMSSEVKDEDIGNTKRAWVITSIVIFSLSILYVLFAPFESGDVITRVVPIEDSTSSSKALSEQSISNTIPEQAIYVKNDESGLSELSASGYVIARKIATVSSRVMGLIKDVKFEEGMTVESGEILAQLENTNIKKKIEVAIRQVEIIAAQKSYAEIELNLADIEHQKLKQGHVSQLRLIKAETDHLLRKARIKEIDANSAYATAELEALVSQELDYWIRAPFTGVVIEKNAQAGEIVAPSSAGGGFTRTGICTIVDMSSLEVEVDISESVIGRVWKGQDVSVKPDAYPDRAYSGSVIAIIPAVNRARATVKVRIAVEQLTPDILPDMGVNVAFFKRS
jgi:RND family efflux transporter MFP subunit